MRTPYEWAVSVSERYERLLPVLSGGRIFCDVLEALSTATSTPTESPMTDIPEPREDVASGVNPPADPPPRIWLIHDADVYWNWTWSSYSVGADREVEYVRVERHSSPTGGTITDGRPCDTDAFLVALLDARPGLDLYDMEAAIKDWIEGDWPAAMEGLTIPARLRSMPNQGTEQEPALPRPPAGPSLAAEEQQE